jgi:uncharacterized membrane protein
MKYPFLNTVNVLFKLLAWVVAPVGIGGSVAACVILWKSYAWWAGVAAVACGVFATVVGFVALCAASELVALIIDIERNTRGESTWQPSDDGSLW